MIDAPDTPASSTITNHAFVPENEWWTCCALCGLAESAHTRTTVNHPAVINAPYRCPECVTARDFGKPMPHEEGTCP